MKSGRYRNSKQGSQAATESTVVLTTSGIYQLNKLLETNPGLFLAVVLQIEQAVANEVHGSLNEDRGSVQVHSDEFEVKLTKKFVATGLFE